MSSKGFTDLTQEKHIRMLFALVAFFGGVTTILIYVNDQKHKRERKEIDEMEKELKQLQLEKLRRENGINK